MNKGRHKYQKDKGGIMTKIKISGAPRAVRKMAEKIVRVCKSTKCKYRKDRPVHLMKMSISIKLNAYAVQELRKLKSKKAKLEVV